MACVRALVLATAVLLCCHQGRALLHRPRFRAHARAKHPSKPSQTHRPRVHTQAHIPPKPLNVRQDLLDKCTEEWRDATLDHFSWGPGDLDVMTFKQRYFVCDRDWGLDDSGKLGPIFLYLGNEADVTLYLNNTGLMWESAPDFSALLVFAEHRYYGASLPYNWDGVSVRDHMRYLSAEQAMADYAELVTEIKQRYNAHEAPVIGFGGSYGGMLAAWMRMKYPHILDGAVAASAPIWNFEGENPPFDPLAFSKGVTWDASALGGAAPHCADNVRTTWRVMETLGKTPEGRATISSAMGLCESVSLDSQDEVTQLRDWLAGAWDFMAMGNYPYPSGYILNGGGELPAWPVRVACERGLHTHKPTDKQLLQGMARAAAVYYNYTGTLQCLDYAAGANEDTDQDGDFWGYQYCTEMFMPFAKDGKSDMFWSEPWEPDAVAQGCHEEWGVWPRRTWAETEWGGRKIGAASRIVFSNGLLDPWHGGGVLRDINDDLQALMIPEGAHHLDLMFSHPDDPRSVQDVRRAERDAIQRWVQLAREENSRPAQDSDAGRSRASRVSGSAGSGAKHESKDSAASRKLLSA